MARAFPGFCVEGLPIAWKMDYEGPLRQQDAADIGFNPPPDDLGMPLDGNKRVGLASDQDLRRHWR
jgi:hypothetical protein